MVECYLTTIGNHAVDEAHILDVTAYGAVAFLKLVLAFARKTFEKLVEDIVAVQGCDCEAPSCCSEIFRE